MPINCGTPDFDQISTYALKRLALLVAKRHRRAPGYGLSVVAYRSANRLGLINLNGTVVSPRPFKAWRGKPNAGGRPPFLSVACLEEYEPGSADHSSLRILSGCRVVG